MTTKSLNKRATNEDSAKSRGVELEAIENLMRSSDRFQNRLGKFLRKQGLTLSQFNVLRILHQEGNPLPCLTIAERMIQVVPAITGIIDRLESSGWVQRDRCSMDRRVIYVELTDKGKGLLRRLHEPYDSLQKKLMGNLSVSELTTLNQLLQKALVSTHEVAE